MGFAVKFEIKGANEIKAAFDKAPELAISIFQKAVEATGAVLAKNSLRNDPVPWRTGRLTQSFQVDNRTPLKTVWKPTANYAVFVNDGTKYQKANPFMQRILMKSESEINQVFSQALKMFKDKMII